jgi:deoxycytidylate deaminase
MTGPCAKLTVIAIIENYGRYWIGTNFCRKPQKKCPRRSLTSGSGYNLCKTYCGQPYHAEEDACIQAGALAKGATLYLIGHIYCCDNCKKVVKEYGIKKVVIGKYPKAWRLDAPIDLITPEKKK